MSSVNGSRSLESNGDCKRMRKSRLGKLLPGINIHAPYANHFSHEAEDTEGLEMVQIGSAGTLVKKYLFEAIDWSSYIMATRRLLGYVFPRRVLNSHQPRLDPIKVNDVVVTVMEKCRVKGNLVRKVIVAKCCDEYKRVLALKKAGILY